MGIAIRMVTQNSELRIQNSELKNSSQCYIEHHHNDKAQHHAPGARMRVLAEVAVRDEVFSYDKYHSAGGKTEHPGMKYGYLGS